MTDREPEDPPPSESVTQLFAEFLGEREAGSAVDVEALCARAGPRGEELRARLRALAVFDRLGSALRDGVEEPTRGLAADQEHLGRYRDLQLIGRGGLSRVYLAFDPDLQRTVALKILASEHVSIEGARAWSLQEGRTIARLLHPGVVRVFEVDEADGVTFLAMEFVDGPSLADVLDELKRRATRDAETSADARVLVAADALAGIGARARLGLSLARALAACHAGGVLHRDVKPANVLLESPESPKLIDFGLAHLDAAEGSLNRVTQRLIGTPASLAPEQVESGQTGASARSDQFSFGVLLYELLTLKAPFQRSTRTQTLDAVTRTMPMAPRKIEAQIPADLETICLHALERVPAERYPSMDALANDLEAFLDHRAILVSAPSRGRKLRLWARRHRRDLLLGGIPALVLLAGLAAWQVVQARDEAVAFEEELATRSAAVSQFLAPQAIQDAYLGARDLAARAHALESGFVTGLFLPDPAARVQAHVHAISRRMSVLIDRARDEIRRIQPDLRAEPEDELLRTWEEALVYDAVVCPECPANRVDRERGRIDVPVPPAGTKVEVARLRANENPMSYSLEPVPDAHVLPVGQYRITWSQDSGGLLAEFDLDVHRRTRRATIVLERIPAEKRARFVHVPAGTLDLPSMRKLEVPEFWVYAGWLTAEEIRDGPRPSRLTVDESLDYLSRISPGRHEVGQSNFVPGQAAYAARGLSARLPSVTEAQRLLQIELAGQSQWAPMPEGCRGEFCSGLASSTGSRSHLIRKPGSKPPCSVPSVLDNGSWAQDLLACRLVVSRPLAP